MVKNGEGVAMFSKILIANRGEIAVRIIRACREMGISTVAVYSQADKDALHVRMADESYCIGGAQVADSYLNMAAILEAAVVSGAQAIHPGYGLLSENAKFVSLCEKCNIEFIGPSAAMIEKLGDKDEARKTMRAAGVPVTPGSDVVILYLNIKLLYVMAPDEKVLSITTTKGAIFTTIGWVLASEIYSLYIGAFSNYDKFYGSISNILILLLWIYILSYIFVLGMIINAGSMKTHT